MQRLIAALKRKFRPASLPPTFPAELIWQPDHQGEDYLTVLARLHAILAPASYFEIGSRWGDSLALASCTAIAVDPQFCLGSTFLSNKPQCHLYAMTSDDYFATHSPAQIFNGPIDFAFLDGLHLAEFLLRDFINTEAYCKPESVIVLHDCFPLDASMTRRDQADDKRPLNPAHPDWWTGDVWLTAEALFKYRPDLTIIALDAQPTGLLLVTNLNPASKVLQDHYVEITAAFEAGPNPSERYRAFAASVAMTPTSKITTADDFTRIRKTNSVASSPSI